MDETEKWEGFLHRRADYVIFSAMRMADSGMNSEETERSAKKIMAFYEVEKSEGRNPDPKLYIAYLGALMPSHSKKERSMLQRFRKYVMG